MLSQRRKSINFERYDIKFIPLEYFFGYRKIRTDEGDIFLAENEKLLIDALLRPKECGNFDEIEKMFDLLSPVKQEFVTRHELEE